MSKYELHPEYKRRITAEYITMMALLFKPWRRPDRNPFPRIKLWKWLP